LKTLILTSVFLFLGAVSNCFARDWQYDGPVPEFSSFAIKGGIGMSGVGGGSFSYNGSIGWITNGIAIWATLQDFSVSSAFTNYDLSGGEVEFDLCKDVRSDFVNMNTNKFEGAVNRSFYIPLVIGFYGDSPTLTPTIGIGGGIRQLFSDLFADLSVIYRKTIPVYNSAGQQTNLATSATAVTGTVDMGLSF